ncbi:HalOD1 output domain-containing protein [Halostella salina]|uniref:HalOD1 output domain-containing protein n=1 Tax=Halostella salina TaxID=1547897 RepID=UPI000EF7E3F7|nr:HalOD1 output domain-containing protein [Halostella salina]
MDNSVRYDPEAGTYTARCAGEGPRKPVHSVVETVAAATDSDPVALDPLYEAVDPRTLDRLVGPDHGGDRSTGAGITFRFEGCTVTVQGDGRTVVSPDGE